MAPPHVIAAVVFRLFSLITGDIRDNSLFAKSQYLLQTLIAPHFARRSQGAVKQSLKKGGSTGSRSRVVDNQLLGRKAYCLCEAVGGSDAGNHNDEAPAAAAEIIMFAARKVKSCHEGVERAL